MHLTRQAKPRMLAIGVIAILAAALVAGCGDDGSDATPDQAFVRQMVPHHQMAVEMAEMAKDQAQHPEVETLADNIIRTQNAEITQMTEASKRLDVEPEPVDSEDMNLMASDGEKLGVPTMDDMGMDMETDTLDGAEPFDMAFIDMMVPHHQGAVFMAQGQLAKGRDPELRELATGIIESQQKEIRQMSEWRAKWYGEPSPDGGDQMGEM